MVGSNLAHYEILEKIGEGGMGVVYRARDSKLGREVAIKVLPESISQDAERLARFEREAKLLAALNHASIATLYGFEEHDGTRFLAMELVAGETLADVVARGGVPIDEALDVLRQIASALEAAHDKGVIHRDLKPANIKITPDGQVKVLDFGLAKAFADDDGGDPGSSLSPTLTKGTALGTILGTAAYMSPEQAKGKAVDQRADIWAFGCVAYEVLTGKRAFSGDDVSETLASVLRDEPDWSAVPAATPASLRRMLRRALTKKPGDRLAHIRDARLEIDDTSAETLVSAEPARRPYGALLATFVAGALAAAALMWLAMRPEASRITRLVLENPTDEPLALESNHPDIAITPDGTHIVFWSREHGRNRIYVRPTDSFSVVTLTEDLGTSPRGAFVSDDGQWIGYHTNGALNKIAIQGGAPIELCSVNGRLRGASWLGDWIVFATSDPNEGLLRVSADGGEPEPLTQPDRDRGEVNHKWPQTLPSGAHVLFAIERGAGGPDLESTDIALLDLATSEYETLIRGATYPRYVATGHIVFATTRGLEAIPFDVDRLEVTGQPRQLEGDVVVKRSGAADFDVSRDGTLVYTTGGLSGSRDLLWVDRQGLRKRLGVEPAPYVRATLSPDGRHVATLSDTDGDLWLFDVETQNASRFTFKGSVAGPGLWTPDGRYVAFTVRGDTGGLYRKRVDGTGQSERIADAWVAFDVTPDGRHALALVDEGRDLFIVPLEPGGEPELLLPRLHTEYAFRVSPDGKWIAFASDQSGRFELYLRPFPNVNDGLWQVSTEGAFAPRWGPTSEELFYRSGNDFVMATLQMSPAPRVLSRTTLFQTTSALAQVEVSPDGERFLVIEPVSSASNPARIHVVLNWLDELERELPSP